MRQYEKARSEGQEGRTGGRTDWSARVRTITARARSLWVPAHSRAQLRSLTHTSRRCCPWRLRQDHWTTDKEEERRSREGGAESKGRDRKGESTLSQGERIT